MSQESEEDEFKKLYKICKRNCITKLLSITHNRQDSEDLFAEAISIYWVKHKQGKIKNSKNIPAYVFTIAKNLHFTKLKSEIKIVELSNSQSDSEILNLIQTQDSVSNEVIERIRSCLDKIGQSCRQLLKYKYVYNYSYQELTIKLNRNSSDSLKTQTYRCLKRLKEMMQN